MLRASAALGSSGFRLPVPPCFGSVFVQSTLENFYFQREGLRSTFIVISSLAVRFGKLPFKENRISSVSIVLLSLGTPF